jgi:hypothetical protein
MSNCHHQNLVDPPHDKRLRVCLDCAKRIIECSLCDNKTVAGDIEGWMNHGTISSQGVTQITSCPSCEYRRMTR